MNQVHKENLTHVENANPGRQGLELEIFGMEGVPAEIIDQHNTQVTQAHFAEEQERARLTGNPMRGAYEDGQPAPNRRPKITESLEEIEERANKFRTDRKNGVIMPPVEVVQKPVRILEAKEWNMGLIVLQTPPVAQPPYAALPPVAPAGFPPGAPGFPKASRIPSRPQTAPYPHAQVAYPVSPARYLPDLASVPRRLAPSLLVRTAMLRMRLTI
jgi:hypothetical protein